MRSEKTDRTIAEYRRHAEENGIKLNPNDAVVEGIVKGLLRREEEYGERYCPCRRVSGRKEEDKKIICPCAYHRDEVRRDGHCHCNLFVR